MRRTVKECTICGLLASPIAVFLTSPSNEVLVTSAAYAMGASVLLMILGGPFND